MTPPPASNNPNPDPPRATPTPSSAPSDEGAPRGPGSEIVTPHPPPGSGVFGMWLFLAGLTMLFGAGMLAYLIIRFAGAKAPPPGTLEMPSALWLSTAIMIGSSVLIYHAVTMLRWEKQPQFRLALAACFAMGVLFLAIQGPSLWRLLDQHREAGSGMPLYGMVLFLIVVHAFHVIGGLIPLGVVTTQAFRGRYDHEHYASVRYVSMYWHYLDGVWLVMFFVLLATA